MECVAFDFLSGAQSDMSTQEMCPLSLLRPILTCPAAVSVEIVDGNVKMTLGMIWTIILRFAIQDISVEGEWWGGGEDVGWPRPLPNQHSPPSLPRNLGQGRLAPVVSAEDGTVPQRQCAEFPHQVRPPVSMRGLCWGLGQDSQGGERSQPSSCSRSENDRTQSMLN